MGELTKFEKAEEVHQRKQPPKKQRKKGRGTLQSKHKPESEALKTNSRAADADTQAKAPSEKDIEAGNSAQRSTQSEEPNPKRTRSSYRQILRKVIEAISSIDRL